MKNILAKLHLIMLDVDYIQKDKKNDHHKYSYASELAIKRDVGAACRKHKVVPQLSTSNARVMELPADKYGNLPSATIIDCEYTFHDVDSGESLSGTFVASGPGRDDKGLWAATTNAIKYIFTSNFLIPTGDDAESDNNHPAVDTMKPEPPKPAAAPTPRKAAPKPKPVTTTAATTKPTCRKDMYIATCKKHGAWLPTKPENYYVCDKLLDTDYAVAEAEKQEVDPGIFALTTFSEEAMPGPDDIIWTILLAALNGKNADKSLDMLVADAKEVGA